MTEEYNAGKLSYEAIRTFGRVPQCIVAMEELAELIQEISKAIRKRPHNITEEFVDVEIIMEQIKLLYVDEKQYDILKQYKLRRLSKTIQEYKRVHRIQ